MSDRHKISPRWFLAKTVRRLREANGMSRERLAQAVFVSESLVRGWERGTRVPQPDHLKQIDAMFRTQGILADLRQDLINASEPLEWMNEWRDIERRATVFLWFETIVVPGLLQIPEYAAATFLMSDHLGDTEKLVEERLQRQQILEREDDPPTLVVVVSEAVLLNNVGGADVMRRQLSRLIEMAQRNNVFLHVVPLMTEIGADFLAHFIVAGLDGGEVAYLDNQLNGEVIEEPENLAILRRKFERFRAHALSQPDSIDLIKKIMEERWTP
ncbi:MAG TPA: helix-turn-helix transcriptional regulator [Streptosporangiaceae bacterium]|nr:helix-turn-helix transcriptional regulator [Streptosporangiaceae bacterium]